MRYNMLTVLSDAGVNKHKKPLWLVRCDCGAESIKIASAVRTGCTKSCGCLARSGSHKTHGLRHHPLYATWCNIKARCNNPQNPSYKNYGGRGISYAPQWSNFAVFLQDVGEKPYPEATLDRIDNDGNYAPNNVRWADRVTQRRNNRQVSPIKIDGKTKLLPDWCKEYGITVAAVHRRLKNGEDIVSALIRPKAKRFR